MEKLISTWSPVFQLRSIRANEPGVGDANGTPFTLTIDNYWPDFRIHDGKPDSVTDQPNNPAVLVTIRGKGVPATETSPNPHGAGTDFTATGLSNAQVLLSSRWGHGDTQLASAEIFEPSTGMFSSTGSMSEPRVGHAAVMLKDGRALLVYNHTATERSPLNVAVSGDGRHWQAAAVLENEPGEYAYPAVIQSHDGRVHITYTWKRQRIKHVVLDPAKFRPRDMDDGRWPQ